MARRYVPTTAQASNGRKTPEEFAAILAGDPAGLAKVFNISEESARALQGALARNFGADDPSIARQVEEQTQRVLGQFLRDNGGAGLPANLGHQQDTSLQPRSTRAALYNKRAPGAQLDGRFRDFGEFAAAVWHGNRTPDPELLKLLDVKNYSSGEPASGGFLVPERLRSDLLSASLEMAVVRPRALVVPMDSLRVPFPTADETSHVSSVFGGLTGYWTEESATLVESEAKFSRVVLDTKKLAVYGRVPNELFQDAGATLTAFIDAAFPATVAHYEDAAFLTGSGVGEPLGVLNATARISVTRTTANRILWADILNMAARLLPQSWRRAVWVASNETIPELGNLQSLVKNVAGTENVGGSAIWITDGADDRPTAILGRPLIFSEKVSQLGTAGDLSLVDFGFYLLGDRMTMSLRTSEHRYFDQDQTAVRIVERVDGRPWLNSALTPKNGGDTLSPYVRLG